MQDPVSALLIRVKRNLAQDHHRAGTSNLSICIYTWEPWSKFIEDFNSFTAKPNLKSSNSHCDSDTEFLTAQLCRRWRGTEDTRWVSRHLFPEGGRHSWRLAYLGRLGVWGFGLLATKGFDSEETCGSCGSIRGGVGCGSLRGCGGCWESGWRINSFSLALFLCSANNTSNRFLLPWTALRWVKECVYNRHMQT